MVVSNLPLLAQNRLEDDIDDYATGKERIRTLKIAHITNKAGITSEEGTKFFPLYNEYLNKLDENRQKQMQCRMQLRTATASNDENTAIKASTEFLQLRRGEQEIIESYYEKFKTALPKIKVAKVLQAELNFQKILLEKLIEKRLQNKGLPNK
jgi:hypothetical protein